MTRRKNQTRRGGRQGWRGKWEVKVGLDVYGFSCSPDEITKLLGMAPTRTWLRGDPVPRTILRREDNRWILNAACDTTVALREQVDSLLEQVSPAASRFAGLPSEARVQIFCAVYDSDRAVDLSFSKKAVEKIAALGAEINIDYYDLTDGE